MLSPSLALAPLKSRKILFAHTNSGRGMMHWHELRAKSARSLGYDITLFAMADHFPHTIFPYLDKLWRKRDRSLMRFYDVLGAAIDACDVFIHYNGALVHPQFLAQFDKLTIYHCADDPDSSNVLSRPVAAHYDICAISNAACIEMYRSWGCRNTFFWPLGSFIAGADGAAETAEIPAFNDRTIPLIFMGSKLGVPSFRFIGKYLGSYKKKRLMTRMEREFPELVAHGAGWSGGSLDPALIPALYKQSRVGFNFHNSLGPVNTRLYDLAAFGVCQICDNKATLSLVFDEGSEIVGFDSVDECIDLIRYYLAHPSDAERIGFASRDRFLQRVFYDRYLETVLRRGRTPSRWSA